MAINRENERGTTVATSSPLHAQVEVPQFSLEVVTGAKAGSVFRSEGERVVIGSSRNAAMVLSDKTVSRFHCSVEIEDGVPVIRDLSSSNGTLVDGVLVREAILRDGSLLTLGETQVRFNAGGEKVSIPLSKHQSFGRLVGSSVAMRAIYLVLEKSAQVDSTILITGPTGTGKELAAESVHRASRRADGPFIVVDCGSIPPDLLESELFGHEKGSFTGAVDSRIGAFKAADGGTLFLDEIGELAPHLQPKLLRALESRQVKPVGSVHYQPVDVRVIAATHRTLEIEVNEKRFRSDLYYRIAVIVARMPALRDRLEDLPTLVDSIVESRKLGNNADFVRSPEFLAELSRHSWPGNVRELRNYVEKCIALQEAAPIQHRERSGPPPVDLARPLGEVRDEWKNYVEHRYLEALLAQTEGNVSAAARIAGLDRTYLYRLLWNHGLK